jgi:hypothetical protein
VVGDYCQIKSNEQLEDIFDAIISILDTAMPPHHIDAETTRNISLFGVNGFFAEDCELLVKWADFILHINATISNGLEQSLKQSRGSANMRLFGYIVRIANNIKQKLGVKK